MVDLKHSEPLLQVELGKEESQTQPRLTSRRVAICVVVCSAVSLLIVGVSARGASGGGHVIDMVTDQRNDTDGTVPVPAHGLEQVARLVTDPQEMYNNYGIVNMPIAYLNFKGFINFCIQLILFLGGSIWAGKTAMKRKAQSAVRFSKVSIAFQVFGQIGAAFGMKTVVMATKPWQGTEQFLVCCLLISQHASTITAMTGLANNSGVAAMLVPDKCIAHDEHAWAKMLVISGSILSIPVLVAMIVAAPYTVIPFGGGFVVLYASSGETLRKDWKDNNTCQIVTAIGIMVVLGLAVLHFVWLIMAITEEHMWLMLGAFMLEFMLPLFVLFVFLLLFFEITDGSSVTFMFIAFSISMCVFYIVTTCVPAAILMYSSNIGYMEAAPTAFWGKKISVYGTDTFVLPEEHAENVMQLWWSQVIGFFS